MRGWGANRDLDAVLLALVGLLTLFLKPLEARTCGASLASLQRISQRISQLEERFREEALQEEVPHTFSFGEFSKRLEYEKLQHHLVLNLKIFLQLKGLEVAVAKNDAGLSVLEIYGGTTWLGRMS